MILSNVVFTIVMKTWWILVFTTETITKLLYLLFCQFRITLHFKSVFDKIINTNILLMLLQQWNQKVVHIMKWSIIGFPLQVLDLSDYCHITDQGIAHIVAMHSLSVLLLSRTKLTDNGMPFIAGVYSYCWCWACTCSYMYVFIGLTNLQELSLDNTAITDDGMRHVAELRNLAYLSLSDTRCVKLMVKFMHIMHCLCLL